MRNLELGELNWQVIRDRVDDMVTVSESEVIEVTIDILPGNHRNTLNPTKQGALAVAILSNAGFDALTVDPATAELSGALAQMRGKRWFTQDKDVDGDGIYDLVLHFDCGLLNLENSENNLTLTAQTADTIGADGGNRMTRDFVSTIVLRNRVPII